MVKIDCNVRVSDTERERFSKECDTVPTGKISVPKGTYTFEYDYPLSDRARFQHDLKGDETEIEILKIAARDYKKIYQENEDTGAHGIWGHYMGDLFFEGVTINTATRFVTFSMGS